MEAFLSAPETKILLSPYLRLLSAVWLEQTNKHVRQAWREEAKKNREEVQNRIYSLASEGMGSHLPRPQDTRMWEFLVLSEEYN